MKIPLSWLRDYVDIKISPEELAMKLTYAGLEVEQMEYIGLPRPAGSRATGERPELAWDRDKIFVGEILEVKQHPNADRLTLVRVAYGADGPIEMVTGAPNIKVGGSGYKVALALEGSRLYDGHKPGWELATLKKSKIRGIESGSMVCSEKELAISDEHEGIILLPGDAPVGTPLADYLGDIVFDIKINPNMARCASVIGIAREIAALTGAQLKPVPQKMIAKGAPIAEQVKIVIKNPELNPRFTAALIRDIDIKPSPFWLQRRLLMAGMRPISNIVDVTNYVMLEVGEPLHAFDYDKLVARAVERGKTPTIITRLAEPGEELETLDGVKHKLDSFTILVCDTRGSLSIGGVMGGAESEVDAHTKNVLLEAAAWEYINIRRTMASQKIASEAGYRFSRGVHPAQASVGLKRAIELMRELGGGEIARGIIDEYPNKPKKIGVNLPVAEVKRQLGVEIPAKEIVRMLEGLEFKVEIAKDRRPKTDDRRRSSVIGHRSSVLRVTVPDHRLDVDGTDDLVEEIARLYGYENIPISRMNDELPPQRANVDLEQEERVRDLLIDAGLQDVVTYRFTTPEREALLTLPGSPRPAIPAREYVRIENPISADRSVLRQSLISNLLDLTAANLRYRPRVAVFEIGPVFWMRGADDALLPREVATELPEDKDIRLPLERRRLAIVLTGARDEIAWQGADTSPVDFYDLKGIVETLLAGLHLTNASFVASDNALFHPGRGAQVRLGDWVIGELGELHPVIRDAERFDLPAQAVLVGEFDLDALFARVTMAYKTSALSRFPGVAQDLALIVDENVPAERVHTLIAQTGGALLQRATLFDVYRGDQIAQGKKSLAYALTFQAPDRTLSDADASKVREKIVARLKREIGAEVRGGN
ncbi:MAG: phenylalanine--tRNA ligase subunit beta [Chloroflexi bacterium]|nr:phenylalanine--tRNA ligase subunit beta [Chloroflexota bacterium]